MSSIAPKVESPGDEDAAAPDAAASVDLTNRRRAVGRLITAVFEIRTLHEAERLSKLLATYYLVPGRAAAGIWELLSNAVEHGNLEISFEEKTALLQSGAFAEEIDRRLRLEKYSTRAVRVEFSRTADVIALTITDEGRGFDFSRYLNANLSTERPNGRGIFIARQICFDSLVYQGCGNQVTATTALPR